MPPTALILFIVTGEGNRKGNTDVKQPDFQVQKTCNSRGTTVQREERSCTTTTVHLNERSCITGRDLTPRGTIVHFAERPCASPNDRASPGNLLALVTIFRTNSFLTKKYATQPMLKCQDTRNQVRVCFRNPSSISKY
uniref:Uncharacterized protein n=1 Tax=Helianthus annuus TaxID=4232 RepID=A0A251V1I4_HELAN